MGYSTDFKGEFTIDKPVDEKIYNLLKGLADTRRMKRDPEKLAERIGKTTEEVIAMYGKECDLWVDDDSYNASDVVDGNQPPKSQPSLHCQWQIQEDHETIKWDGCEKFYNYIPWIIYIINVILKPNGYIVNGEINWYGEERSDVGTITIMDNEVSFFEKS